MFPLLISFGPFKLYTLALIALIGFFAGLFVVWKRGKELHYEEKDLFDVVFVVLFWMFIGARLGYIATHFTDFWGNMVKALNFISHPGWYFPMGVVGASVALYFQAKKHKWDLFQLLDLFATGIVLTQAIMSLGTFLAGIDYGLPTTSFIGLPFSGVFDRRIPIQLLEFVGYLACFCYLWRVEGVYRTFTWYKRHRSQAETGYLMSIYLCWWGLVSLIAVLFKTPQMVWGGIRFDVFVSMISIIGGAWLLLYRSGTTPLDMRDAILGYFGLGKTRNQKAKERLDTIRNLLDE